MNLPESFFKQRRLVDMVENQTSYDLKDSSMHIFETHKNADAVCLKFGSPVLASMFQGKKVMHLADQASFDFLPGESLMLPSNELMCIDFPEARKSNPTRCLALEIGEERIERVIQLMNERMEKADGFSWELMDYNFHFTNDPGIYQILQRLVYLYTENHPSKDFFVSNMLQELIVRILQANMRKTYERSAKQLSSKHRFAHVIQYIKDHLHYPLSVKELSTQACMSESNFYKVFRQELGMSPIDFVNKERVAKAKSLFRNGKADLTEVYLSCGFKNRSYFNRVFKRYCGMAPSTFQKAWLKSS